MSRLIRTARKTSGFVNPIKPLIDNPLIKDFVEFSLTRRYRQFGLPVDLCTNIIETLVEYADNPNVAKHKVWEEVINFQVDQRWKDAVKNYVAIRYDTTYSFIQQFIEELSFGSVVIDVGAGTNNLGLVIAKKNIKLNVIGTDVFDYCEAQSIPNLEYLQQTTPLVIPVENKSADLVILNTMLHHVSASDFTKFMKEMSRILKPHGKCFILEDTYSLSLPYEHDQVDFEMTEKFLDLVRNHGENYARNYFIFMDWYTNIVVKQLGEMSMPYNFHSMELWEKNILKSGFVLSHVRHIGFLNFTFHRVGLGLLVFNKS